MHVEVVSRRSGLRPCTAGSPVNPAVSSSLSYGLLVHLPLLSTLPCGNAVTFSYRPEYAYLERTCTSPTKHHHKRTVPRASPVLFQVTACVQSIRVPIFARRRLSRTAARHWRSQWHTG